MWLKKVIGSSRGQLTPEAFCGIIYTEKIVVGAGHCAADEKKRAKVAARRGCLQKGIYNEKNKDSMHHRSLMLIGRGAEKDDPRGHERGALQLLAR